MAGNKNSGKGWRRKELLDEVIRLLNAGESAELMCPRLGVTPSGVAMAAHRCFVDDPTNTSAKEVEKIFDRIAKRHAVVKKLEMAES